MITLNEMPKYFVGIARGGKWTGGGNKGIVFELVGEYYKGGGKEIHFSLMLKDWRNGFLIPL